MLKVNKLNKIDYFKLLTNGQNILKIVPYLEYTNISYSLKITSLYDCE